MLNILRFEVLFYFFWQIFVCFTSVFFVLIYVFFEIAMCCSTFIFFGTDVDESILQMLEIY